MINQLYQLNVTVQAQLAIIAILQMQLERAYQKKRARYRDIEPDP